MKPEAWRVVIGLVGLALFLGSMYWFWVAPYRSEPAPVKVILDE